MSFNTISENKILAKISEIYSNTCTVKPRYIATNGKMELWQYNKFGDRLMVWISVSYMLT